MLSHRHSMGIQEADWVGFHPDQVVPEPFPVSIDKIRSEWLRSRHNRGTVRLQYPVELFPYEIEVWPNVPGAVRHPVGGIREDEIDRAVRYPLDARFIGLEENLIDEFGGQHAKECRILLNICKVKIVLER